MIAYQSTLQTEIPDRLRGRAFALFDVLWNAARLVSLGLGGLVADAVGIRAVYIAGGLLLLVAAGYGATAPLTKPPPPGPAAADPTPRADTDVVARLTRGPIPLAAGDRDAEGGGADPERTRRRDIEDGKS